MGMGIIEMEQTFDYHVAQALISIMSSPLCFTLYTKIYLNLNEQYETLPKESFRKMPLLKS
jgi:predicted Kef-type K+ transport protein